MTPQRAKRSLGQNFLVDPNLQRKIVAALGATAADHVLEIGPGRGALTDHLVGEVARLTVVELDDALAAALADRYGGSPGFELVHGDILEVGLEGVTDRPEELLVLGNIPYNITSPILFHLLSRPRPRRVVLMVQDEVARRLVAPVGTKAYGALTVGVRSVARVDRLFGVGRGAFKPVPGVDSAVVELEPFRPARTSPEEERALRRLVRGSFQWRRKQIGKTLRQHPDLSFDPERIASALGTVAIEPSERPERLSPDDFLALSEALASIPEDS